MAYLTLVFPFLENIRDTDMSRQKTSTSKTALYREKERSCPFMVKNYHFETAPCYRVYSVEREDEELERNSKPRAMRVGVRRVIQ